MSQYVCSEIWELWFTYNKGIGLLFVQRTAHWYLYVNFVQGSSIARNRFKEGYGMFLFYILNEQEHNSLTSCKLLGFVVFDEVFSESYLIMIRSFQVW